MTRPDAIESFEKAGRVPTADNLKMDQPYAQELPVLANSLDFGMVGAAPVSHHVLIAYDDLYSVAYFERRLRPYWRRNGMDIDELLRAALKDYRLARRKSQSV